MAVTQRDAWRAANARGELHARHELISTLAHDLIVNLQEGRVLNRKCEPYKESTVRSYVSSLRLTIMPEFGRLRLDEVTTRMIEQAATKWLKEGISGSTIRNRLMPLRVIYADAVRNRDVAASPFAHVRLPKINGPRRRFVSWEEGENIIAILPPEIAGVFAVAMYAGLRAGEIGALRREDIDLDRQTIDVRRSIDFPSGVIGSTKNGRERIVPIVDELLPFIEPAMMIAPTVGFVFPGVEPGTNFPYSHYAYVARKTQVTLGRDPISLHVLRHSFASRAATRLQPDQVRDLLGHASFDTSLEWYIKSPDGWQDAARELLSVRT